jgi:surfeit locus 1 family protein
VKWLLVIGVVLLTALGVWQLQRLGWKQQLIARVEQRVHAPPIEAAEFPAAELQELEYRAVTLRGQYLNDRETLVQAVTRLGGGFWVMTPLRTAQGFTVLVNRGFVRMDQRQSRDWARIDGELTVTGLLRLSEPGGGFLRDNQPDADRWYSRDVAAIGRARGLELPPYFVDDTAGDGAAAPARGPVAGLTVVKFNDNHLQYALTWFALALLLAVGGFRILRR